MKRVISVNVGIPAEIGGTPKNRKVLSGIIKNPVAGSVIVGKLNLDGDRQADLSVHGGEDKAVYVYPSEHYAFWRKQYPGVKLDWGTFGENLTTVGILESDVHIGDELAIGSAKFQVTQPRFPCFKLGIRFNDQEVIKTFLDSERTGFCLKVVKEGRIKAGDPIKLSRSRNEETITSIVQSVKKSG